MTNKRTLPKNVDGKIRIGPFTIKNFFKWIGIPIILFILFIRNPSQGMFVFSVFAAAFSSFPFMEFKHKQTGMDFIREIIEYDLRTILADFFPKYVKHKEITFERSEFDVSYIEKFTFNQKTHEIKRNKQQKT